MLEMVLCLLYLIFLANSQELDQRCREGGVLCQNKGLCEEHIVQDGTKVELCKCERHFSGKECEYSNSVCTQFSCKHGSRCQIDRCICNSTLYTGRDCSQVQCKVGGKITSNYCKNGGICFQDNCICPNNTRGDHCELIACGAYTCSSGYCHLDKCICDIPCVIGCDQATGTCKTEPDSIDNQKGLKGSTKVIIGVVSGVVAIVILPALYAMYNMSIENRERNRRLQTQLQLERMTHAAYLEKEGEKKAKAAARAKAKEEKKLRKTAKQKQNMGLDEDMAANPEVISINLKLEKSEERSLDLPKRRSSSPTPSRKRSRGSEQTTTPYTNKPAELANKEMTAVPEEPENLPTSPQTSQDKIDKSAQPQSTPFKEPRMRKKGKRGNKKSSKKKKEKPK